MEPEGPNPPPLHELERAVMEEVWRREQTTVREVMDALNGRGDADRAYTTYMTIMSRLDSKGLLSRRREGKTDFIGRSFRGIDTPIYGLERRSTRWSINSAMSPLRTSPVRWLAWTHTTADHFSALPAGNDMRHSRVFGLLLAIGAGGLGLTATAVVAAAVSVHHQSAGAPQLALTGIRFTYPSLNGAATLLLILAVLGTAVLKVALTSTWRQRRAYRAFTTHVGPLEPLRRVPGVNVITDSRPQAFCAGYLRPLVYVSRRTVDLLTDDHSTLCWRMSTITCG